jgi:hypothetical protein
MASTMLSNALPDLRITLEDVVVDGRLIAARSRWRGTNTGGLMGRPPTGQEIDVEGLEMWRFDDDGRLALRRSEVVPKLRQALEDSSAAGSPGEVLVRDYPKLRKHLETWGLWREPNDELTRFADAYGSDKGIRHPQPHFYTYHYHRLFEPWRDEKFVLIEIGLLNKDRQDRVYGHRSFGETYSGLGRDRHEDAPSLRMWRDYFRRAELCGIDLHDFSSVRIAGCRTFVCDQSDAAGLSAVLDAIGAPPRLVIDDGCHASQHQQTSFFTIFPRLAPGGVYIIEDLQWQPPGVGEPSFPTTVSCLEAFPAQLARSPLYAAHRGIEDQIERVVLHDSLARRAELAFVFKKTV